MERVGIPVDLPLLTRLRARWPALRASLIERVDRDYGVFDGTTFRGGRWASWLAVRGIPWPRHASGWLALDDDTFQDMAVAYPAEVGPMWELRKTLNKFRIDQTGRRPRRAEPDAAAALRLQDRPQPAQHEPVPLRVGRLGPGPDPAGGRARPWPTWTTSSRSSASRRPSRATGR